MPDAARPLRSSGVPLVSEPDPTAGGAHTLRNPATPTAGLDGRRDGDTGADVGSAAADAVVPGVADAGESLLTSTRVVVRAPRHRIEKRAPILWTIEGIWSWLILAGLQVAWYFSGDNVMAFWNWVALSVTVPLAFMSIVVAPWWRYLVARWDVSDTAVCSRTGWWTTQFRIAPLVRLQTVYTTRNFFERWFGLSTVHASTASAHGSVEIRGLSVADAEALAQHLIAIAHLDAGDGT